jgi:hypothetical protein
MIPSDGEGLQPPFSRRQLHSLNVFENEDVRRFISLKTRSTAFRFPW